MRFCDKATKINITLMFALVSHQKEGCQILNLPFSLGLLGVKELGMGWGWGEDRLLLGDWQCTAHSSSENTEASSVKRPPCSLTGFSHNRTLLLLSPLENSRPQKYSNLFLGPVLDFFLFSTLLY